jgi:hypothetical protein
VQKLSLNPVCEIARIFLELIAARVRAKRGATAKIVEANLRGSIGSSANYAVVIGEGISLLLFNEACRGAKSVARIIRGL